MSNGDPAFFPRGSHSASHSSKIASFLSLQKLQQHVASLVGNKNSGVDSGRGDFYHH